MILNASTLTTFQRCPRAWLQNNLKPNRRWKPRSLFLRTLRRAILRLSGGSDLENVVPIAVSEFLESAANPGLDVERPFEIAGDFAAILKTVLARVHACKVPSLTVGPTILLSNALKWSCGSALAKDGLHSWVTVDYLNDESLARLLHSWYVFGDCAATGQPMTLHVIEVGRGGSDGRQHTAWCRAFRHPAIAHRFAFQGRDGKHLNGDWKPVWFADSRQNDPKVWIELMRRDRVNLLHDVAVKQVSVEHARQFREQMAIEADRMAAIEGKDWRGEPMRRTSCDSPLCVWQSRCYS